MFGFWTRRRKLKQAVALEVRYLTALHGDNAIQVARDKAARGQQSRRRKVYEQTVKALEGAAPPKLAAAVAPPDGSV